VVRHRIRRKTMGKEPRKMSRSLIVSGGTLVVDTPELLDIIRPTADVAGVGTGEVFTDADTQMVCSPNSIIKYVNLRFLVAMRSTSTNNGWFEYAVVLTKEASTVPALSAVITAGIGTQTLSDLCNNLFRGKCLWNDAIAVSKELPRVLNVSIKIPDSYCKQMRGQYLQVIFNHRSTSSTDTTGEMRVFYSHQYKCYI